MKQKKPEPFADYRQTLAEDEQALLAEYFADLDAHVALSRGEHRALREDFERALLCYAGMGVPLETALARLAVSHLGGFYVRPPCLWFPLDDAAKIYPLSMKRGQMAVFRLSACLRQSVVPELLQIALLFTIKRFPSFATTVKKGFFWHYLDTARRRYAAEPETGLPCQPLRVSRSGSQSFRVLYYSNRISVEYFHILTDGTGGMAFLKALTATYLRLLGVEIGPDPRLPEVDAPPATGELVNEFPRVARTEKGAGFVDQASVQMSGKLARRKPCRVLHFKMDAARLHAAAKARNATVTAYVLALLFVAGKYATDAMAGSMSIQVPVNMRKFCPSETVRNFALYCGVRLPIQETGNVDAILPEITRQLAEKASERAMGEMASATARLVSTVRYVPLFIKAPVARMVYGFLGDKIFSNTLSNLGTVDLPPEMAAQLESLDFVLGTGITNRAACSMVTLGNVATLSVSKLTADPSFEEKLYDLLCADGLTPAVEGSAPYEN